MYTNKLNFMAAVLACGTLATPGIGQELERGWTLVREDLELFIDPAEGTFHVEGTLRARLEHDETSSGMVVGLNSRQQLMRVR